MRPIFWGFCINQFGIGPLHYISIRSDFGFELAEIFVIEKRLANLANRGVADSPTRQVGESSILRPGESLTLWLGESLTLRFKEPLIHRRRVGESAIECLKENFPLWWVWVWESLTPRIAESESRQLLDSLNPRLGQSRSRHGESLFKIF